MFDDTEIELLGSLRSPSRETIKANPNPYRKGGIARHRTKMRAFLA